MKLSIMMCFHLLLKVGSKFETKDGSVHTVTSNRLRPGKFGNHTGEVVFDKTDKSGKTQSVVMDVDQLKSSFYSIKLS